MTRVLRMAVVLVLATVVSTRLPINFVVVGVAMLAMEELRLGDLVVIVLAGLALDHLGPLPLGFSILPLAALVVTVQVLRSRIYLQSLPSRAVWLMVAVTSFYGVQAILVVLRGAPLFVWSTLLHGILHAVLEGGCAAVLTPYFHRYLTLTWSDLRRPQSIVL